MMNCQSALSFAISQREEKQGFIHHSSFSVHHYKEKTMPSAASVHINRALDDVSVAFQNEERAYVWQAGCARRPVSQDSDQYFIYSREFGSDKGQTGSSPKVRSSARLSGTEAVEQDYSLSSGSYECREYVRRDFISDREISKCDSPLAPVLDAGRELMHTLMNEVEDIFARILLEPAQYAANCKTLLTTGGSGTSWASVGSGNSSPLKNLRDGRAAILRTLQRPPNTLLLSDQAAQILADHPEVKDILKYERGNAYLEGSGLPDELRGLDIVVGSAVANTAAAGAAYSGDFLFIEPTTGYADAVLCYVPPGKTIGPRAVTSFAWFDAPDQTTRRRGLSLRQYRDDKRKGMIVEAAITLDFKPIVVDGSNLITGAYLIRGTTL
jgi:hypothetical protein